MKKHNKVSKPFKFPEIDEKTIKLFIGIIFVACIANMWSYTLYQEEPRRGIVVLEMLFRHNFIQPTVFMKEYFNKPPLFNWLILFFSLFKTKFVNEFTIRLPSLLATGALTASIYWFVKDIKGKKLAVLSALVFATTWQVLIMEATKGEPDMVFSLFTVLSLFSWYKLYENNQKLLAWTAGYFFVSLSLLTKGLPGIVFFILSTLTVLFIKKRVKEFFSIYHIAGIIIGLIPFFLWIFSVTPEKAIKTLLTESLNRTAFQSKVFETLKGIVLFLPRFILPLMPWPLIVAFLVFKKELNIKSIRTNFSKDPFFKTVFLLLTVNAIPYLLSPGTRLGDLLILLPFASILIANTVKDIKINQRRAVSFFRFLMDILLFTGIIGGIVITKRTDIVLNATIFFIIAAYFIYFFVMRKVDIRNLVILAACVMFLIRGFYSGYYLSIAEFKRINVKKYAWEISEIVKDKPVGITLPEHKLGFYVEKFGNSPVHATSLKNLKKGRFIITDKPVGKTVKKIKLEKKTLYLCKTE